MSKTEVVGKRLYHLNTTGSAGIVTDTIYRRCFWPQANDPVSPFRQGSSGIEVEGPPTPRNIIFPLDTVFLNRTRDDVFFEARTNIRDVQKDVLVTTTAVVDGQIREVFYKSVVTVQEPVREITEIPRP